MKKCTVKLTAAVLLLSVIAASFCGCSLTAYTVEELRALYPQAIENSLAEPLYYWKETVNAADASRYTTCNVYAELDDNYEPARTDDGGFVNMEMEISRTENSQNTYHLVGGRSESSAGGEAANWVFENGYNASGEVANRKKTAVSVEEYVQSEAFKNTFSLAAVLQEFSYLTVDDMDFAVEDAGLTHKGHVVECSFAVKDSYLQRYEEQFGEPSVFAGSKYATLELSYDRFSSVVIYTEEQLGGGITSDEETYKLEVSYLGPRITVPSYDSDEWKNV